ncbi:hypothetical protein LAP8965_01566 [Lactiplantibacillus plantarum]|nr:hypothetical protein LAP8963_01525 [Lactiplantibacillus plantarum]SPE11255.1 hypothetical protein LAP8964_01390 [Lactiplantibacillus plantarum]SPH06274.1 hypothetical protein LAP8965_01566 [Lactiplantibacillus plantarum]SPH09417.1 hypothetical protein LAP8966_01565 [Lactiplantibacillus plantarum]
MNKPKMIQLLTILVVESFFTLHEYLLKSRASQCNRYEARLSVHF